MEHDEEEVAVVIYVEKQFSFLRCALNQTLAQVRAAWHSQIGAAPSVAFFLKNRRFLGDSLTVAEALELSGSSSLELHTEACVMVCVEVLGSESSPIQLQVPPSLTPSAVSPEIARQLNIAQESFRLLLGDSVLDQDGALSAQGLRHGGRLVVDRRLRISLRTEAEAEVACFASERVSDLRLAADLPADLALVLPGPRVVPDSLPLFRLACSVLSVERKVALRFQPLALGHLQQRLLVALSSTPRDLHEELTQRFQLVCEFRLSLRGKPLTASVPLKQQEVGPECLIEIDVRRACVVRDLWSEEAPGETANLFSTDPARALVATDRSERLLCNETEPDLDGTIVEAFGASSGQRSSTVELRRDVQRSLAFLVSGSIVRRGAWARDELDEAAPGEASEQEVLGPQGLVSHRGPLRRQGLPESALLAVAPPKAIVKSKRRFRILRGAARPPQDAAGPSTRITVHREDRSFSCSFAKAHVTFSEVMTAVGRQSELSPRLLLAESLFCCGCQRRLSHDEEAFQLVPAPCCRVRSLELCDRRTRDSGTQTAVLRRQEAGTEAEAPERRDASTCVGLDQQLQQPEVIGSERPAPMSNVRVSALRPNGRQVDTVTLEGDSSGKALLSAAARRFPESGVTQTSIAFTRQVLYQRQGRQRTGAFCYNAESGNYKHIDIENGAKVKSETVQWIVHRFLRASSPLPPLPRLMFRVCILADTVVRPATAREPLLDPFLVVMMIGISSGKKKFWELSDNTFVNAKSGEVFATREKIPKDSFMFHELYFMRDKDSVPFANVPAGKTLLVRRREGFELDVKQGALRVTALPRSHPDIEAWVFPKIPDRFEEKFTAAARDSWARHRSPRPTLFYDAAE